MPVIENLKNFIKERHHNHNHQQQQQQQQQQPKQPNTKDHMNPPPSQAQLPPADQKHPCQPAGDLINPNANALSDVLVSKSTSPLRSPTAAAIGGTALAAHGEQAEALIEKARLEKARLPVYEGLPDHFVLIEKMGEYVTLLTM
jgi:hypothetical protein